ncbi:hypothetical protein [Schaedlerella arabinosiphila]|uniref:hypothetical protein n=1 Tax=Schaedlerella arabinosiphila TaxID=2044587 RepID=UPI0012F81287|nr:hypothetical protein [Schaedlerella arabinosiphila]
MLLFVLYDDTHNTPTVFYCFLHQIELSHQYFWDFRFSVFLCVATLFSPHFLRSKKSIPFFKKISGDFSAAGGTPVSKEQHMKQPLVFHGSSFCSIQRLFYPECEEKISRLFIKPS